MKRYLSKKTYRWSIGMKKIFINFMIMTITQKTRKNKCWKEYREKRILTCYWQKGTSVDMSKQYGKVLTW